MTPIDILYTPLDVPDLPSSFDIEKLERWMKNVYPQKELHSTIWTSNAILGEKYPWDLTFAHYSNNRDINFGWIDNFDKEFPELVEYFTKSFNINEEDIGVITFLPMRENFTGLGFWHSDVDETGIRLYFANELPEKNPLLIMPTKEAYTSRPKFQAVETPREEMFRVDKIQECKILKSTQAYYLNNVRAVHSPLINEPCKRISSFITPRWNTLDKFKEGTKDLIVNSAIKYKDFSIMWE